MCLFTGRGERCSACANCFPYSVLCSSGGALSSLQKCLSLGLECRNFLASSLLYKLQVGRMWEFTKQEEALDEGVASQWFLIIFCHATFWCYKYNEHKALRLYRRQTQEQDRHLCILDFTDVLDEHYEFFISSLLFCFQMSLNSL